MHLSVDFWINRADDPDALLSDAAAIAACARNAFDTDPHLVDLARYPLALSKNDVTALIRGVSKPYPEMLWYRDSEEQVTDDDYDRYTASLDLTRLPDTIDARFGMVVERTAMRTWPTDDVVYKSRETIDLDRFQENGLFPSDAIVVLHDGHAASTDITEDELIGFVKDRIASYKKPKSVVFRTEPLPRHGWPIDYDTLDAEYGGGNYPGEG